MYIQAYHSFFSFSTNREKVMQIRVVHGLGQPTGWVGLDWVGVEIFDFWWVGLGRGSETAETQKLKIFICAEFIEPTNV